MPLTSRVGALLTSDFMLGETVAEVFGFDVAKLAPLSERIGPTPQRVLAPPVEDRFLCDDDGSPFGSFSFLGLVAQKRGRRV